MLALKVQASKKFLGLKYASVGIKKKKKKEKMLTEYLLVVLKGPQEQASQISPEISHLI